MKTKPNIVSMQNGRMQYTCYCKQVLLVVVVVAAILNLGIAQQASWIWYPGDVEIVMANKMQNRRTERGTFFPVFWKMDNHYVLIDFHRVYELAVPETIDIYVEGKYNVKLDGKALEGMPRQMTIPAGKHKINIKVYNQAEAPALYVKGKTIVSDSSWRVTFEDKEWIDETGKTSDISATKWLQAASSNFKDPAKPPSSFALPVRPLKAAHIQRRAGTMLIDFGRETFGYLQLHGLRGKGTLHVYYGESEAEALDTLHCETLDRVDVHPNLPHDYRLPLSKAFRYVQLVPQGSVLIDSVSMLYEYAALTERGTFKCNDGLINRVYETAKYTFELNTREFFIDGIKRDRWIWSGDAYQSYLMNYYLYNDNETVKRTLYALRGKDPVTAHINTIMDYTFYWFLGIYDYYLYTADKSFILQNYDRMQSLMEYVLKRRNKEGLMEWMPGDWIFIDWATGLSKEGAVSFEQILLARSLETMVICAGLAGDEAGATYYHQLALEMKEKLFNLYWNHEKQALVHSIVQGRQTNYVTRYANMFGIFFNYFSQQQKQAVKQSVLLNNEVPRITTPYMRFYELEALCAMGEQTYVLKEMKEYWGGMLKLGATSFWEEYNPAKLGNEHYAMYGRKYGKSLCHAWGASPLYLLGKYYLGVAPTSPGYATYRIQPSLGGLQWMEGKVPTPEGAITLSVTTSKMSVKATHGIGTLIIASKKKPVVGNATVVALGNNQYQIDLLPNVAYNIMYEAV